MKHVYCGDMSNTRFDEFFIEAGDREDDVRELDKIIRQNAPSLKPVIEKGMFGETMGYGLAPYKTKSMKVPGTWPILAMKAQKNYISLYACVASEGRYIAEKYEPKLGKVNCGKSCIRFKKLDDLNRGGLVEMLQDINRRFEAGEKLYGM